MEQKPCIMGREKRHETKTIMRVEKNGMKQKSCIKGRAKWHETKAIYDEKGKTA